MGANGANVSRRYDRAPSPEFRELSRGILAPLLLPRRVAGLPLDAQFREGDHLGVYCGMASLVDASRAGGRVRISAHATYSAEHPTFFRDWAADETGFAAALDRYLGSVLISPRFIAREGTVHAAWASLRDPWMLLDREAEIGYASDDHAAAARAFPEVAAARDDVRAIPQGQKPWAQLKEHAPSGLDQLAVDPGGRLVLLELKDASAGDVYVAPLQILQYAHEWSAAFGDLIGSLRALRTARIEVGLSPPNIPELRDSIRPVIGFGEDTRSPEVRRRFREVLKIANRHRPPDASEIEVWSVVEGVARRLEN